MLQSVWNSLIRILTVMLVGTIVGGAALGYIIYFYSKDLPDYQQLTDYTPPLVTRLYSSDNKLMEEYAIEHRIFVPIKDIPKRLVNAFLAAEDRNYYEHPGVDIGSLFRAILQNFINVSQNKSLVGGSTITQQVVKNFLLTNERSLTRKIKEAILSFRISQVYSKDRILELYLNQIYLGNGSYGIASAALKYFDKSLDELSIEETAFIAALPKAPSNYDPVKHYDKAKMRRDWVIGRMEEVGYITTTDAEQAKATPINIRTRAKNSTVHAPFYAEAVRREIANKYGSKILYEGGLTIHTSLDPRLQEIAEKSFRKGLISYDRRHGYRGPIQHLDHLEDWSLVINNLAVSKPIDPWKNAVVLELEKDKVIIGVEGNEKSYIPASELTWAKPNLKHPKDLFKKGDVIAVEQIGTDKKSMYALRQIPAVSGGLVVMDPHTGKVLAMVGGFNYHDSEFNRAIQAKRQPGSAFKPFVYLAALESGYTPASIIVDGPIELSQGPGLPMWRPKNYSGDFLGPTTLRRGVERSRNAMTVRLGQALGIKKITSIAKRFGINENPANNFSIVLGAAETTLMNLTNAYAILVNGGMRVTPSLIERVQDLNGYTLYKRDISKCDGCKVTSATDPFSVVPPKVQDVREVVIDPRTAYQMVSILEGVVQRGTAASARRLNRTLGGKTGTTNDSNDVWFIGFSPDLVVGNYIGFDSPRSLGAKETGASGALPIFIDFMEEALKGQPDKPFKVPSGINMVKIDAISGKPTSEQLRKDVIYEAFKTGTEPSDSVSEDEEIIDDNFESSDPEGVY